MRLEDYPVSWTMKRRLTLLCPGDPSGAGSRAANLLSIPHPAPGLAWNKVKQLFRTPFLAGTSGLQNADSTYVKVGSWVGGRGDDVQNI